MLIIMMMMMMMMMIMMMIIITIIIINFLLTDGRFAKIMFVNYNNNNYYCFCCSINFTICLTSAFINLF